MKKFLFTGFGLLMSLYVSADYSSMEFKYSDGTTKVLTAPGLTITVEGANLKVTNSDGQTLSIPSASLASMQFVNGDASGVSEITADNSPVKVYNVNGIYVGEFDSFNDAKASLPQGVYVIRNAEGETFKLIETK